MKSGALLLVTMCAAGPLAAQATVGAAPAAADPLLKSTARSTTPGIVLEFATEEQTARAQVGGRLGSSEGSLRHWGLTVSGPLAKSGNTTLATGEGLAAGTSAEILARYATSPGARDATAAEMSRICQRYLDTRACSLRDLPGAGRRELDNLSFQAAWVFGASVKVGRTSFEFTDPSTFVDASEAHNGWSASASVGRIQEGALSTLLYYAGASYRHEEAYVGGGVQNVCTPIGASTSTVCREIAIGGPVRRRSDLVQLEARSFPVAFVGLAPRATYEVNSAEWAFELPIYLRQGDGPFNGGISVGWDSERDDVHVSLFVGTFLGLF